MQYMLGDTVNKRALCILLECNLVPKYLSMIIIFWWACCYLYWSVADLLSVLSVSRNGLRAMGQSTEHK